MEEEANAFAAELLMPEHWLIDMINTYSDYNELIKQVCDTAQVSFMAALYNIIPLSPANHMFYIQDKINAFCHIKFGSNINQPIFLYKEGSYDPDWLSINMQSRLKDITNETMDVSIIIFKNTFNIPIPNSNSVTIFRNLNISTGFICFNMKWSYVRN